MRTRTALCTLGLAAAVGVGLVAWQRSAIKRQKSDLHLAAAAARETDAAQLASARARLSELQAEVDSLRASEANKRPTPAQASRTSTPQKASETLLRMRDDPELQLLRLESNRAVRAVQYQPMLKQLGLSEADAAAFDRIIASRDERTTDITATAGAQNLPIDDPGVRSLLKEVESSTSHELQQLLGDEAYATYLLYERTALIRRNVSGLAATATVAGDPLTPTQLEQTVQILSESTPGYRAGWSALPQQIDWTAAEPRLREILSSTQLEAFLTTESSGPNGAGSRFLPRVHAALDQARKNDNAAAGTAP